MPGAEPTVSQTLPDFPAEPPPKAYPAGSQLRLARRIAVQLVTYPPCSHVFRGTLDAFELVWPLDGTIEFLANLVAAPNQLALLSPGRRYIMSTGDHHVRALTVQFQIDRYPSRWRSPRGWPPVRELPDGDIARPLLCYLLTHAESRDPALIRPALSALLAAYITGRLVYNAPSAPAFPPQLIRALDYIRRTITTAPHHLFTAKEVAAAAGLSRSQIDKQFVRWIHHPTMREIYNARLDRAVHLLARTNYPIGVVAAMTGFCDNVHLNQHTNKAFGQCASALRKALIDGTHPYPQPRSPLLAGPTFAPEPFATPIPPESFTDPHGRSSRLYQKHKRRRKIIRKFTRLFRSTE